LLVPRWERLGLPEVVAVPVPAAPPPPSPPPWGGEGEDEAVAWALRVELPVTVAQGVEAGVGEVVPHVVRVGGAVALKEGELESVGDKEAEGYNTIKYRGRHAGATPGAPRTTTAGTTAGAALVVDI